MSSLPSAAAINLSRRRVRMRHQRQRGTEAIYFRDGVQIRCHHTAKRQWEKLNGCGTPDIEFVNDHIGNSFTCAICMEIMTDPVNIGCSHIFCSLCLRRAVTANTDDVRCPTCRQPFLIHHVRIDHFAKRMIDNLRIKCPNHQITEKRKMLIQQRTLDLRNRSSGPRRSQSLRERPNRNNPQSQSRSRSRDRNHNNSNNNNEPLQNEQKENKESDEKQAVEAQNICNWTGEYRQMEQHLDECGFAIIPCETCYIPIFRNKSGEHEVVCPWKVIACNRCSQEYRQCDLANHRCPLEVIRCSWCTTPHRRDQLINHYKQCDEKPIKCEFYEYGCRKLIVRGIMKPHLANNQSRHLSMVRKKCNELNELEEKYTELNDNYEELQSGYEKLEADHEELQSEHEELQGDHETLKDDHETLKEDHDALKEEHDALDTKVEIMDRMQNSLVRAVFGR